jgi:hypothetical protein
VGVALFVALSAAPASAQTVDYPGGTPPQVAGEQIVQTPAAAPVAASPAPQVLGTEIARGETQGGLALTGADIAGLVLVGFGAIAVGVTVVRRTRRIA